MTIKSFMFNLLQENTYVVSDETKECVIIDCGAYYDEERDAIINYIKDNELKPMHLLCRLYQGQRAEAHAPALHPRALRP